MLNARIHSNRGENAIPKTLDFPKRAIVEYIALYSENIELGDTRSLFCDSLHNLEHLDLSRPTN